MQPPHWRCAALAALLALALPCVGLAAPVGGVEPATLLAQVRDAVAGAQRAQAAPVRPRRQSPAPEARVVEVPTIGAVEPHPQLHQQSGVASWYGPEVRGRRTANGERFDAGALTAAHRSLPFGTYVLVVCERTGRSVVVRINDRGPHVRGRIIDLSERSAADLGIRGGGVAPVRVLPLMVAEMPSD